MSRMHRKSLGWPHEATGSYALPASLPNNRAWPKISIVTPTFNQGHYIEETILSVARQGYPNLEHIIVDGASTDDTPQVIDRHRHRFSHVIAEPDRGQSDAINKGMALATGEILTWLNSDDMLAPGALGAVAMAFERSGADMVAGICELYQDGVLEGRHLTSCADGPLPIEDLLNLDGGWNAGQFFYQPEVLFTRDLWQRAGGHVDVKLFYSMDYDLWLRFAEAGGTLKVIGRPVAMFRMHEQQKTHVVERFNAELHEHKAAYVAKHPSVRVSRRGAPDHDKRLRLVFLNDHGWKWGAGIAHQRLADACRIAGHDVFAFALGTDQEATPDDIVSELEKWDIDVVVLGNVHGTGLPLDRYKAVASRWPTFACLHDFWWLTGRCAYTDGCTKLYAGCDATCPTPDQYPALDASLIRDAWDSKRDILAGTDGPVLLAMSRWAKDTALHVLGSRHSNTRVESVTLGLRTNVFRPFDKQTSRAALKLPKDKLLVLCSATDLADRRKGPDFVRAIIRMCKREDVVFVTLGHGGRDIVEADPRVIYLAYQKNEADIARLYSAVDLILCPSREETFGQVFVEAASCGTPCLAFDNSGVSEAVTDRVTGLLAADQSVESLYDTFSSLLEDRRQRADLGVWGRLHAENMWSLEASYLSLFRAFKATGILDRFGLAHKISLESADDKMRVGTIVGKESGWAAGPGVEDPVGPHPEQGITRPFRWLLQACTLHVRAPSEGPYILVLALQNNFFKRQRMTVLFGDAVVACHTLRQRQHDAYDYVSFELFLSEGRHEIDLAFSHGRKADWTDGQSYAVRMRSLTFLRRPSKAAFLQTSHRDDR